MYLGDIYNDNFNVEVVNMPPVHVHETCIVA